ncbi:GNAT family N-acetyltransferase [Actinomadura barringtoniae]|uniref:GNAT family N-acetyltransferase n=1 Tax=Actinomadura barringtoniae TaxID=1427535 RepID=A0A939T7R5_9ACTN|nr:GNAT family N-acetyltransferase [Actinomadura barringtoniae]MBO2446140.1 GNAT family N-acetyltransferase [Actinomadura barringtoniae]
MPSIVPPVVPSGRLSAADQPTIKTGTGLELRPWTARDAPLLYAARQDEGVRRWSMRAIDSVSEAEELIASFGSGWKAEKSAAWAVTRDGEVLGHVGLRTISLDDGVAECAYWVLPAARGRGIAPQSLLALSNWCFETVGLHRIELYHSTRNAASCQVAEKTGYALEGTLREALRHEDGWHDMHIHARLDERD